MRSFTSFCSTLLFLVAAAAVAWFLGLGDVVRQSAAHGHLLDWVMAGLCFFWLILILKIPWDLYFQAHEVQFELQRSRERGVAVTADREGYIRRLRFRLGWLAVALHLFSAALIAGVAYFSGGTVGYWFAGFYVVSTLIRPTAAGYVYLSRKLRAIGEEVRYPRDDVLDVREKLEWQEQTIRTMSSRVDQFAEEIQRETNIRDLETRELRQQVHVISREFETTVSRLTDNQEVIQGIQAFVRLVTQASRPNGERIPAEG